MQNDPQDKQLRSFGLILGGIFGVIAAWPLIFHGAQARSWASVAAAVLILPALVYPRGLYWIHKGWMALGHVMGWINTRIILGLVFLSYRDTDWFYPARHGQGFYGEGICARREQLSGR